MHGSHGPRMRARARLAFLFAVAAPTTAAAQPDEPRGWALVPSLGFGFVEENRDWRSGGAEAGVELEYGHDAWRWSGQASVRGLGLGCSEGCYGGGPAIALGVSRALGPVWAGAGAAVIEHVEEWHPLPFGRLAVDRGPARFELRVEVPRLSAINVYLPIVLALPIRVP